ncbi:tail fiber protein [bacterium]|nr:tail fiber protein [bacterium]
MTAKGFVRLNLSTFSTSEARANSPKSA